MEREGVGNSTGANIRSCSEKPIHLARHWFPELENRCETAQLGGDTAEPD
jgi:hypothetical protein